jgi:tripartite-type tricarboxylate transporter receptor subunit TctC
VTLTKNLPYDPVRDLAPITLVATQNLLLLVTPSVPAQSVKELVALAKSQPGKLSFSSAGNGTGGHLSGELFKLLAGVQMLHVPYRGVAPAIIDVVNGQVTMTFASINSALPQMRSNRLRGLAVTGAKRSQAAPELPTMMEAGVKDYVSTTWYGVSGPGRLPPALVKRLNADITAVIAMPDVNERIAADGAEPVGNTPEQFSAFVKSEIEKWRRVIEQAGLKPS